MTPGNENRKPHIEVRDLTMAYGSFVVMRDLNFKISRSEVTVIMGGSGCGKSTLLRHLIGLKGPDRGDILYDGRSFVQANEEVRTPCCAISVSSIKMGRSGAR